MAKSKAKILVVDDNSGIRASLKVLLPLHFPQVELTVLPTRYPQGSEKQLIQALTGREVPAGKLPAAARCAVFNVSTCAAVARAVHLGQPLTHRIVTVHKGRPTPKGYPRKWTKIKESKI